MNGKSLLRRRHLIGSMFAAALPFHPVFGASRTLRIGILSGEDEDLWRVIAANAATRGLTLKIIAFSEGSMINEALATDELDANAFQHVPFLNAESATRNYHLTTVGTTYFAPISLYSQRWNNIASLPRGASIGIPSDPSNEGRALFLLRSLGLIELSSSSGRLPTVLDVTANPHDFTIRELDDAVLARSLSDLDAAVIVTEWAAKSGIDLSHQRLAQESLKDNPYINVIVVRSADAHASWIPDLLAAYHQDNVRHTLQALYHGAIVPAW